MKEGVKKSDVRRILPKSHEIARWVISTTRSWTRMREDTQRCLSARRLTRRASRAWFPFTIPSANTTAWSAARPQRKARILAAQWFNLQPAGTAHLSRRSPQATAKNTAKTAGADTASFRLACLKSLSPLWERRALAIYSVCWSKRVIVNKPPI